MFHNQFPKHSHKRSVARFFALTLLMSVSLAGITGWAHAIYLLSTEETAPVAVTGRTEVPEFASKVLEIHGGRTDAEITLAQDVAVAVSFRGRVTHALSHGETVSQLLDRLSITPSPLEMIGVDVAADLVTITVSDRLVCYERITEADPFTTVRVASADLPLGTEQVVQSGVDGKRTAIYEQVWTNGSMLSRQFVEEVETTSVDEIVAYGTAVETVSTNDALVDVTTTEDGGVLTFASGGTMKFSEVKSMTATAYTAGHGGADYTTALGTFVRRGVVAVDKRVIPLGSRLYIVTDSGIVYGVATAEDTGVRGNKVDLYMDTYDECINFGRRSCKVYILE